MIAGTRSRPWRKLVRGLAVAALAVGLLLGIAVAVELQREARDRENLRAGSTLAELDGAKIRYRLTGAELPGPAVVIMSGFGAVLEQWGPLQAYLHGLAPVLTYDHGSTGLSDHGGVVDADQQAEELASLASVLALHRPLVLVAYSSASLTARAFARLHPELLGGIVFLDPTDPEQLLGSPGIPVTSRQHYEIRVIYERNPLLFSLKSAVGWLRRGRLMLKSGDERTSTPDEVRAARILLLASHWWATYREGAAIFRSSEEAKLDWSQVSQPVAVLSLGRRDGDWDSASRYRLHRLMAPGRLILRTPVGWDHPQIPNNASYLPALRDLIGEVVARSRGEIPSVQDAKRPVEEVAQPPRVLER